MSPKHKEPTGKPVDQLRLRGGWVAGRVQIQALPRRHPKNQSDTWRHTDTCINIIYCQIHSHRKTHTLRYSERKTKMLREMSGKVWKEFLLLSFSSSISLQRISDLPD